jgi:TatD DNase family protein
MIKYKYFDAHTHANLAAFHTDYKEVVDRALTAGVGMVNVGTQKDTSLRAVEIAREYPDGVYAAVGLHPIHTSASRHDEDELGGGEAARAFTSRGEEFNFEYYKKLALDPKTVAIGECGLDFYRIQNSEGGIEEVKKRQKKIFVEQIKLAHEVQKPLMIHCRDAFSDLIDLLIANYKLLFIDNPGIIHFFTGTKDDAQKLLEMGFTFTFGGAITYPPKSGMPDYRALVEYIPLDRILSETDAPFVAPVPYRGKRNEPAYVVEVVKKLAEIKNISVEEMAARTVENAQKILGIKF